MNPRNVPLLALSYIRVAMIVFFVAVAPMGWVLHIEVKNQAAKDERERTASCKSVNVIRRTVDDVLRTAALRARSTKEGVAFAQEYEQYRTALHAVPHTPPGTAEVDCDAANDAP